MSGGCLRGSGGGNRRGYIGLLMLLIVVVVGMLIYYMSMGGRIEDEPTAEQLANPDEYPWVEEHRLRKEGTEAEYAPSGEQARISEPIQIVAEVKDGQYRRGDIHILIRADGLADGAWTADYGTVSPRIDYTVMQGNFKGNIDPSKIYRDAAGEDASKLFLICRGTFLILESNMESGKVRKVTGYIYVVGWIERDLSAFGRIHLTSDKQAQEILEWEGKAEAFVGFVGSIRVDEALRIGSGGGIRRGVDGAAEACYKFEGVRRLGCGFYQHRFQHSFRFWVQGG